MILQNLANSSYFKVTGPLTSIQGSANTVARNVPKATALLLYSFNTDKKIYFRSAGAVTVVWLTPPQARALQYWAGTGWAGAVLLLPPCSAGLGQRAGEGKEGRKLFPHSQQCKCLKTQTICRNKERQTRTFLNSCNQGESYCYLK